MHRDILPGVIFAPAQLALDLADGLRLAGAEVTLFTPGPVRTSAVNHTADLHYFEQELTGRGDNYTDLLKKHPFTFVTLARQVQSELIAKAFAAANRGELDIVHIYSNEEDTALPFAALCQKPVVFTHHDPFNFLVKYKNVFPKYKDYNWISMSYAQRTGMPPDTNWVGNVYHGLSPESWPVVPDITQKPYVAYLGRIIEPKGVHLAIAAVQKYNQTTRQKLRLKIAGKHYAGHKKDTYWQEKIAPHIDGETIEYVGFIKDAADKQDFLAQASALIVPSIFEEPFGMVMIEALACGTPVIGLDSGAIPEIVEHGKTGMVVPAVRTSPTNGKTGSSLDESKTAAGLASSIAAAWRIDRAACRQAFETRFTVERMCAEHLAIYRKLTR